MIGELATCNDPTETFVDLLWHYTTFDLRKYPNSKVYGILVEFRVEYLQNKRHNRQSRN